MPQRATAEILPELRRCKRKLEQLCGIAGEIADLGDAGATLKKLVGMSARVVGVRTAYLALVDDSERSLFGILSSGRVGKGPDRFEVLLAEAGAARSALQRRRPVVIRDARSDRRIGPGIRTLLAMGGVAYLPLLGGGSSFGLLILVTGRPHAFTSEEIRLARYCADLISVALQNQRLLSRLAVSEGRFRSLVKDLPAVVYTSAVDPPYHTRYISPEVETLLGYSPVEWVSDPDLFMKLVYPDDVQGLIAAAQRALQTGGVLSAEFRLLDRRGNIRWWRDEAVLVRDPAGRPTAWHGLMIDVTASKKERWPGAIIPTLLDGVQRPPDPELSE